MNTPAAQYPVEPAFTTNEGRLGADKQEPIRNEIVTNPPRPVYTHNSFFDKTHLAKTTNIPTQSQIIASKIIARATIKADGFVYIVAAFQLSHERSFWFVFRSKTARSPRNTWRQIRSIPARITFPKPSLITMDSVIASIAGHPAKITRRYPVGKRYFEIHLKHIATPDYARSDNGQIYQTNIVNRRNGWTPKPVSRRRGILQGAAS